MNVHPMEQPEGTPNDESDKLPLASKAEGTRIVEEGVKLEQPGKTPIEGTAVARKPKKRPCNQCLCITANGAVDVEETGRLWYCDACWIKHYERDGRHDLANKLKSKYSKKQEQSMKDSRTVAN